MEALHVNRGQLVEERKNWDAVHDGGFEEEFLSAGGGQVAQFTEGVDDGAFVSGDGVGSVFEGGADVVGGGLAGFDVEGRGFEEDVGLGFCQPVADVSFSFSFRLGTGARATFLDRVEASGIRDPTQAAGGDAGEAEGDAVAIAQFLGTIFEETDEGPVDVAEAEEAEIVGMDDFLAQGLKPDGF